MKFIRIITTIIGIGIFLPNTFAMDVIERELPIVAQEKQQKIATRNKILTLSVLAALLAISAVELSRLVRTYKKYGLPAIAVAIRYQIPFQPHYLKILTAAADHDEIRLKDELVTLNKVLLGYRWQQVRPQLTEDFVTMSRVDFHNKYGAATGKHMLHLLKTYAAASDLYFRKSNSRTYTRGAPLLKNQVKYMHELDQMLGM